VVAVNNKDVLLTNAGGLDIPALFANRLEHGDAGLKLYASTATNVGVSHNPDDIFQVPADIFRSAARTTSSLRLEELENVRQTENRDVRNVADFYAATAYGLWSRAPTIRYQRTRNAGWSRKAFASSRTSS